MKAILLVIEMCDTMKEVGRDGTKIRKSIIYRHMWNPQAVDVNYNHSKSKITSNIFLREMQTRRIDDKAYNAVDKYYNHIFMY